MNVFQKITTFKKSHSRGAPQVLAVSETPEGVILRKILEKSWQNPTSIKYLYHIAALRFHQRIIGCFSYVTFYLMQIFLTS